MRGHEQRTWGSRVPGGVPFGPWESGAFAQLLGTRLLLWDIFIQRLFLKACKKIPRFTVMRDLDSAAATELP